MKKLRLNIPYVSQYILIGLFYVGISYIYIRPMLKTGMLYSGDDLIFHLNRIEEIYQCLVHGSYIPNISIYT
ncbi:MAG: hypothetical protein ABF649_21765, partial [Bacillus sp. (in: firmicutes)]